MNVFHTLVAKKRPSGAQFQAFTFASALASASSQDRWAYVKAQVFAVVLDLHVSPIRGSQAEASFDYLDGFGR